MAVIDINDTPALLSSARTILTKKIVADVLQFCN